MKVSAILTVAKDIEPKFPADFEYKVVEIEDDESHNLKQHFQDCIKFIQKVTEKDGKPILVHCH